MSVIIGIGGGSGAGKTTLAKQLKQIYQSDLTIVQFDQYCKDQSQLPLEERKKINYDQPTSYDGELFSQHLDLLKKGLPFDRPTYDFSSHTRTKEYEKIFPNKIIVLDGLLVFQVEKALENIDLKIYVEASEKTRLNRRINRDIVERGRTRQSVLEQFYTTVKPMHEIYVKPTKKLCQFVFDNEKNGLDEIQVKKLIDLINKMINQ